MPVKKSSVLAGQRSIHSFFAPNKNIEKKTVGMVGSAGQLFVEKI